MSEERCRYYVGLSCVDGSCPLISSEEIVLCQDCWCYEGCADCAMYGSPQCQEFPGYPEIQGGAAK